MAADSGLPIEEILATEPLADAAGAIRLGESRQRQPLAGYRFGAGDRGVTLIAGCHADEPVGPAMLERLVAWLAARSPGDELLRRYRWHVVPRANPDGDARNRAWIERTVDLVDHAGAADRGYELASYLRSVVRELPGDDVEFGFPRSSDDGEARPENRAVAAFLADGAPLVLHGSFHGMGFAPGPWFLIEAAWADRSLVLRDSLRRSVAKLGYELFDPDRGGEKGFVRIDAGFTTRPDSRAMAEHFERLGDPETAAKFRPSSMELVRSLGGDPFTFVSEMPLFLVPAPGPGERPGERLKLLLERPDELEAEIARLAVRPMPIRDQMRLQLRFLEESLRLIETQRVDGV